MKTKKIYNAPKLEIVDVDSTTLLAGSGGSTLPGTTTGSGDPFASSPAQSSRANYNRFDPWEDEE